MNLKMMAVLVLIPVFSLGCTATSVARSKPPQEKPIFKMCSNCDDSEDSSFCLVCYKEHNKTSTSGAMCIVCECEETRKPDEPHCLHCIQFILDRDKGWYCDESDGKKREGRQ